MEIDLTRRPRTKRVFSEQDMARMRDLYYDRDRPLVQVADVFGVPASTFLRWIAEMGWPRRSAVGPGLMRDVASPPPVASRQRRLVGMPLPARGRGRDRG